MSATSISQIRAREILDSRGNPTIEVDVHLDGGGFGRAAVPSGASTGEHEAWELRDGDKKRYSGKGVTQSSRVGQRNDCAGFDRLRRARTGQARSTAHRARRHTEQKEPRRERIARRFPRHRSCAAADSERLPLFRYLGGSEAKVLPVPMMNILNGGAHSDAPIDFQEFMIMPKGAPTFPEALRYGAEVFHALKKRSKRSRPFDRDRRRRRFRAESEIGRRRAGIHRRRGREGRLQVRRTNLHRARSGGFGVLRQGARRLRFQEIRRLEADRCGIG